MSPSIVKNINFPLLSSNLRFWLY